ncbi:uncharacterized protein [Onthophagus taurus]|uniref:uncharacterized protein n=1 Tax=Onthophagus taurus TaxID=166361 RepID=UPI000C209516|nr:uncharacterized protein LOC111415288 [Onthophagus taurus]
MALANMLKLQNFCCKYDLKCGTMVIGGFQTFCSICYFLFACISAVTGDQPPEHYKIAIPATFSGVIINGMVLLGAIKESSVLLIPYLILLGALLIVICYLGLILSILEPLVLIAFIFAVPAIYLWLTVFSYYQSLVAEPITITNPSMVAYNNPGVMETKYPEVV